MIIKKEYKTIKITIDEKDNATWKGLDKGGNCFFKFDFSNKNGETLKLRVPSETGYAMILLMRDELIKFFETNAWTTLLNSKEQLEFGKLKEALCDNKTLTEKMSLKRSLQYNHKYFKKYANKINEIELGQEEKLIENMDIINQERKLEYKQLMIKSCKKVD